MEKPISSKFVKALLEWFEQNHRPMPWKGIKDPYLIWISEVILQQTRVKQGWDYFIRFTKRFPDIKSLAIANIEEVLKYWEGLGYYTRARNLHASARIIIEKHNGTFPDKYEDILSLKGIGKYTAAAISSFAYSKAYAVLDGNVYRVLSRIFEIYIPIDSIEGNKQFSQLATDCIIHANDPGVYNQAIMDFGATLCKPVNPDCEICPMNTFCLAYNNKTVNLLPVKEKKLIRRDRFFHYFLISQAEFVYLHQRKDKDIWQLLYQFPLLETEKGVEPDISRFFPNIHQSLLIHNNTKVFKQSLTHQNIIAKFYRVELNTDWEAPNEDWIKIEYKNLSNFVFPRIINDYLELELVKVPNKT